MRLKSFCLSLLVLLVSIPFAVANEESVSASALQLSLFPPLQLQSSDTPIMGLRLGLFAKNVEMTGVGLGVVNWTSEDLTALQWGIVNYTGGSDMYGVQFGLCNVSQSVTGIQLGILNVAQELTGIQIGLLNIATGKESLPVLPIINASF